MYIVIGDICISYVVGFNICLIKANNCGVLLSVPFLYCYRSSETVDILMLNANIAVIANITVWKVLAEKVSLRNYSLSSVVRTI